MNSEQRAEYVTRNTILAILSDEEVDRVSDAETLPNLDEGDEYLELEHLSRGVQKKSSAAPAMGHVLPRKAVLETSWRKILVQLAKVPILAAPART